MTEKTLKQSQSDMLYTLRAEFRLEKSVETALYNFLVDDEGEVLSNQEFLEVLRAFDNWVVNKEHQPAFAVGEYVAVEMGEDLSGLMRIEELKDTQDSEGDKVAGCWGRVFNTALKDFDGYSSFELSMTKPATAEQIATFKKAEFFSSKGRKLNKFDYGDKVYVPAVASGVIKSIDKGSVFIIELADGTEIHFDGSRYEELALLKTAEELQEVGDE